MSDENESVEDREPKQFKDEEIEEWFESEEEVAKEEAEATEECIAKKYAETQLRIVRTTMDFSLHTLRQVLGEKDYINIAPTYQRRHRWDTTKRSQLIESFLMNIPIPPIFLFENQYNQYEVMDGRQRLETIRGYLSNLFPLRNLDFWKEVEGRRFSELPLTIQRGLLRRTLSAIVLLAETTQPEDAEIDVRMVLFKRLNTGGIQLNPQELRNALYPSMFNQMLIDTARTELFCQVWGIPARTAGEDEQPARQLLRNTLYKTMADCELVLRFFAIRETIQMGLGGSLRRLMDGCMRRHRGDGQGEVEALRGLYDGCLRSLTDTFDGRPFLLPMLRKPSRPLYDALMVALSLQPGLDPVAEREAIAARLMATSEDDDKYDILVGRGNTVEAIRDRVDLAKEILLG